MVSPRSVLAAWVAVGGIVAAQTARAADADERNLSVRLGQRLTQEDNLYRLPTGLDPSLVLGPTARRNDLVSSSSVALAGHWTQGVQTVVLDASAVANRFANNDDLDNTAGRGALDWDWELGHRWSGVIGGSRERTLAGFADSTSLDKDLFDSTAYHTDLRFDINPSWRAVVAARNTETEHDNETRRRDDVEVQGGTVSVEYHTPLADSVRLEYRRARATFPEQALGSGLGSTSDYDERGASVTLGYRATTKVLLKVGLGRVERTYELAPRGDFAGDVWNAEVQWSPSETTQIAVRRFRELKAHLDAESDHFVATGSAVTATWLPVEQLGVSLEVSREDQSYIGADVDPLLARRDDTPLAGTLRFSYAPRERATFEFAYRDESRESNRPRFDYDAAAVSVSGEVRF